MEEQATEQERIPGAAELAREAADEESSSATKRGASRSSRGRRAGTDRQEVEWQYDAPDGLGGIEEWLGGRDRSSGVAVVEGETRELSDTYYDTADWRIYRAGYALRVREEKDGAEATLKSLASADSTSGEARRREVSETLGKEGVESLRSSKGPVGGLFQAFAGARELRSVFTVGTRRQTFDLILEGAVGEPVDEHDEDIVVDVAGEIREREATDGEAEEAGTRIGEVALDSSEILLGEGEEPARLSRVEVEVEGEPHPAVEVFVTQMREALGLKPARVSKYGAGLFATGQSPEADSDLGPTRIDASLSLGELAFAVLRRQFATMRAYEAGSRLGEDPEEVHDMRVATRRMRAAIKLFQDALPERARWARDELKWVAGALGGVRDLDVQLEQIEEWSEGADEEGLEALSRTGKALERQREEARELLIEALDSARYERLESSFAAMLKLGPTREATPGGGPDPRSKADEPVLSAGPDLLSHRYRKWSKLAEGLDEGSEPEDFHELRKEGKRLRYALEFFTPVYGEETTTGLIKALKALQDDLGRHQDAIVATERLRELATGAHSFPTRAAFVMGLYAQSHLQEAAEVRKNLRGTEAYSAVAGGKAWKGLEKEMKKARHSSPVETDDVKPGKKKKKK
ncbi:hypothetical protein BH24ACT19_BH24ACT19_04300 [soil metagenome]